MDFVARPKNVFTCIGEFFIPPNRAIGPEPRTAQSTHLRSTPITMRSPKQQLKDGGSTPMAKRASESPPFSTRFAMLVFSVRLKFTESAAGLAALKGELKLLKKSAEKANLSSTVDVLQTMLCTIEKKLDPNLVVPLSGGSGFQY
jgi:hypothetical protein